MSADDSAAPAGGTGADAESNLVGTSAAPTVPNAAGVDAPELHSWGDVVSELVDEKAEEAEEDLHQATRELFALLDIVSLLDPERPPRCWFWAGLVPEGEHVSIVAPAGEGKSLLVLALMILALTGERKFIGRDLTFPDDRRVLYVDMENSEDDWAERLPDLGLTQESAGLLLGTRFFPLSLPRLGGLDTQKGASNLVAVLDAYGIAKGDVVVLDSTQRVTEGEENSADTMRRLYNLTSTELKRRGLTVIRTDNTGWRARDRERGTSGKRDDVGMSLLLTPDGNLPNVYTLSQSKRRAAGDRDQGVTFKRVGGNGERLRFEPTGGTTPSPRDELAEICLLLDDLGVPFDAGVHKARDAVQKARVDGTHDAPEWMTTRKVEAAQKSRRPVYEVVDEADGEES